MKKILTIAILSVAFMMLWCTISFAGYSAPSKTVQSGESFSITVTSSEGLDAYTLKLTGYSGLTYNSCSKNQASGETVICDSANKVIGYMNPSGTTKTLGTFSFKAPEVTEDKTYKITFSVDNESTVTSTITVKAPEKEPEPEKPAENTTQEPEKPAENTTQEPEKPADNTTTEPEKPAENTTPEPEKPAENTTQESEKPAENTTQEQEKPVEEKKSSNANLSNLGIRPNDFSGFKSGNTSYSVSVPNNVEKVEVYANKAEDVQTITGTGTKSLSEGSNLFEIEVTAEDGTQKVYKINVIRLAKEETNNPDVEKQDEKIEVALASLQIVSVTLNEAFKPDTYTYTATASLDAKEVIVNGSANVDTAIIDVDAPEEYVEGENIIKITVKSKDGSDKKVYTIKIMKEAEEKEDIKEEIKNEIAPATVGSVKNDNNKSGGNAGGLSNEQLIFCVGIAITTLIGILAAVVRYNKDKKNVEEDVSPMEFVGDVSAKEAMIDAAVATSKLGNFNANVNTTVTEANTSVPDVETNAEIPGERKRGKHF